MSGLNSRTSSGFRILDKTNLVSPIVINSIRGYGNNVKIENFQEGKFQIVSNENGPLQVNKVRSEFPLITETDKAVSELSIKIDENTMDVSADGLTTKPLIAEFPLTFDTTTRTTSLVNATPLITTEDGLSLDFDNTLKLNSNNQLSVVTAAPAVAEPLAINSDAAVSLEYGKGLEVKDHKLVTNIDEVIKPLGALSTANAAHLTINEAIDYGFNSISELISADVPDTEVSILKLKTTDDLTQKGGKLSIKPQGNGRIL